MTALDDWRYTSAATPLWPAGQCTRCGADTSEDGRRCTECRHLVPLPSRGMWDVEALCAQTDPELFFPAPGASPVRAKAICAQCPVIAECLAYALPSPSLEGVWGGTTSTERDRLRAQQRRAVA